MKQKQKLVDTLLPGAVACLLLMLILKPETFFEWFKEKTIVYTIFTFFYVPIAKTLVTKKYSKTYTAPILLGIIFLIPYAIIMNLSLNEVIITLLQTVVAISVFSTIFNLIEGEVEKLS
ncbi:MAG: hypothetical protein DRN78_00055 [Thermoproteota archaeon]|nr:MAG: hypothetical protein DRN78_00055 [Candidatus Korarchaeota archaeon]